MLYRKSSLNMLPMLGFLFILATLFCENVQILRYTSAVGVRVARRAIEYKSTWFHPNPSHTTFKRMERVTGNDRNVERRPSLIEEHPLQDNAGTGMLSGLLLEVSR
jgi:hypothetical protein